MHVLGDLGEQIGPGRFAQFAAPLFGHQRITREPLVQRPADDRLHGQVGDGDGRAVFFVPPSGSNLCLHLAADADRRADGLKGESQFQIKHSGTSP